MTFKLQVISSLTIRVPSPNVAFATHQLYLQWLCFMCESLLLFCRFVYLRIPSHGGKSSNGFSQDSVTEVQLLRTVPIGYMAIMLAMVASMGGVRFNSRTPTNPNQLSPVHIWCKVVWFTLPLLRLTRLLTKCSMILVKFVFHLLEIEFLQVLTRL